MVNIRAGNNGLACGAGLTGLGVDPLLPNGLTSNSPLYFGQNPSRAFSASTPSQSQPQFVGHVNILNQQQGDVLVPEYTTRANMVNIALERRTRYGYLTEASIATPVGYTLSDLSIRFDNLNNQWQLASGRYHYQGGVIYLELQLTVYVTEEAESKPRCGNLILAHEMSHVRDEQVIVNVDLPARLLTHPAIMSDFKAPINVGDFGRRIRGSGDGSGSELEQSIQRIVWIYMSSDKASELHREHPRHGAEVLSCLQV